MIPSDYILLRAMITDAEAVPSINAILYILNHSCLTHWAVTGVCLYNMLEQKIEVLGSN